MKKGFTLIELLAVIVILAIIALIATPIVLNIINSTKESATTSGAGFYLDALENEIALENIKQGGSFNPSECNVTKENDVLVLKCDGKQVDIKVDGEKPLEGSKITFEDGKITSVNLIYASGTVTQNSEGKLVLGESTEVVLAPGLYDENDNLIASWDELINKHDIKNMIEGGYNYSEIYNKDMTDVLSEYDNESKLVIDESVTSIGGEVFSFCTSLTSIIIPNSVTSIGHVSFANSGLTSITIPGSVTIIESFAFEICESLISVTIEEGVTMIKDGAFANSGLTSITIPGSVTGIEGGAFESCQNLKTINYKGNQEKWNKIDKKENWDFLTPSDKVINYNYEG